MLSIGALTSFFSFLITQKAFHADVASVMWKWLKEEEFLPEDQRPTSRARAHYVKVNFPPLQNFPWFCFIFGDPCFIYVQWESIFSLSFRFHVNFLCFDWLG